MRPAKRKGKRRASKRRASGGGFTLGDRSRLLSLLTRAERAANKATGKRGTRKRKRRRAPKQRRFYW